MDGFWTFLIVLFLGFIVFNTRALAKKLERQCLSLKNKIKILENEIDTSSKTRQHSSSTKPAVAIPLQTSDQPKPQQAKMLQSGDEPPKPMSKTAAVPHATMTSKHEQTRNASTTDPHDNFKAMENTISSRWLVWIGGVAFALGGAFLVKYSIDAGLLSPKVRVTLGVILGLAMILGGEALRRKHITLKFLDNAPDYIPAAISGAGVFTAFAALYTAYALHDLISPLVAFVALALVSLGSSGLAVYQGRFFAYLGMVGGLMVPIMVSTGSNNAWALFPYLLVVTASSLSISRFKNWIDIAGSSLFLAMIWPIIWINTVWQQADIIPVGIYVVILAVLNMLLLRGASPERINNPKPSGLKSSHPVTWMSDIIYLLAVVLLVAMTRLDHYSAFSLALVTMSLIGQAYASSRSAEYDTNAIIILFGVLFLLGTWHIPNLTDIHHNQYAWSPILPPGLEKFLTSCLLLGGGIASLIVWRMPHFLRQGLWSSLGNFLPVTILVIAYWRIKDLETSVSFTATALAIAIALLMAARVLNQKKLKEGQVILAAYAAGTTAALALALTMILREAWLSFALSLELVALALIWQKTMVKGLRSLALLLATIILVRLFLNGYIFSYQSGPMPMINWLFYGYGLTALLFWVAAKLFSKDTPHDRLISVLQTGSVILLVTFVSFEIRVLFSKGGTLLSAPTTLEVALQVINWSAASTVLMWQEIKTNNKLLGHIRRVMTIVAITGFVIGGGIYNNIFFRSVDVGSLVIFNLQFLQIFIPATLYAIKAYLGYKANRMRSAKLYGIVSFLVYWFWITVEVRHYFHPYGGETLSTEWEGYAYSMIWLLYAIVILVFGLFKNIEKIRMAGLAVLSIVVLKAFLVDMSALEGLARALSFMGLGASLIGIGYLYQRFKIAESK